MQIHKTTKDKINDLRLAYLNSLPEFQELFIEIMIIESDFYSIQMGNNIIGHFIRNKDGVLIEFYLQDKYISDSKECFKKIIKELSITDIYCKSFDLLLLNNCLTNAKSDSILGVLYRDYIEPLVVKEPNIIMQQADLLSIGLLLEQDASIKELFETEEQLTGFILSDHVFKCYKKSEFVGCGMVLRTHIDWDYCDLGVWVKPDCRGVGIGAQIIIKLRAFAIENNMKPGCGCAIDNIASQKTIEKSGFVSKHQMIHFKT